MRLIREETRIFSKKKTKLLTISFSDSNKVFEIRKLV